MLSFIGQVLSNPKLYGCSSHDGCVLVADRTVVVLDNICQSLKMFLQFETEVEVVGLCQEAQFLVIGERSGNLHLIHVSTKQTLLTNVCNFLIFTLSLVILIGTYHAFILTNSGFFCITHLPFNGLSLWNICTLTMIWNCCSVHIEEFLLISESDFSAAAGQGIASLKLVALTNPDDGKQMRNIVVFSLPTMHQLYSLETTNVSSLIQSGINTDTIYFLEGMYENNQRASDHPVSLLVLRCLTEALPENRLSRLLHKHKFTEAENFAVQFGLDVENVYKVKMSSILERLASESVAGDCQSAWLELVAQAKETLDKIKDNQFVTDYCINTPWPIYESAREMLNYARSRVGFDRCFHTSYSTRVMKAQAKLTTFCGAFGSEMFSGTAWFEFLKNEDLFRDILLQIKGGNLMSAQYLWLRHQVNDFKSDFNVKMLDKLLNTIPTTVSLKELCLWFKDVIIPFVRRVVPKGQEKIAKWLEQRARNLELIDKANWPENGLEMAQVFFISKDPGEIGSASSWQGVSLDNDGEEVRGLAELVSALQGLVDLYKKYNCRLALCDFEKENANRTVFRMLDKVLAAELIPATLEKYIEPYMHHHNLEKDEILLQYIKDLLERYCKQSTSVFDTTWEAKAIAVLSCMSNIDVSRTSVVLYLLQHGPVDNHLRILYECTVSTTSPIGVNKLTFAHRSRALKCLLFLADPCAVETLFKKPLEEVRNFLKCLIFLAQFEILNIPYTYSTFHSTPKEGMIKGLWKNHSHEPMAVKLVAELSLEYKVHDPLLWNGLLQKLISFNKVRLLWRGKGPSVHLKICFNFPQIPNFILAWQNVILAPCLSGELSASCFLHLMATSQRCPLVADLDLTGIAKQYAQLDLPALALGCLLLIPQPEKRAQQIQILYLQWCLRLHTGSVPELQSIPRCAYPEVLLLRMCAAQFSTSDMCAWQNPEKYFRVCHICIPKDT
uniref:Kinetochore associated 1 n=1 Tax=Podarcis muralis TaxID=64176 RepID=A0A670KFE4_PODMU